MITHPTKPIIFVDINGIKSKALIDSGVEMFVLVGNSDCYKLDTSKKEFTKILGISDDRTKEINEHKDIPMDVIGRCKIDISGIVMDNDYSRVGRLQLLDVPIVLHKSSDKYDIIIPHTFLQHFDYKIESIKRSDRKLILYSDEYKFIYKVKDRAGYIVDVVA